MKSIRLSLIVYFLLLLTAALGAVSWFSYRTTAQALRDRQADAQKMIETQCDARSQTVRADLDRHILLKARTMANMSRSMLANTEGLVVFGAIGAAAMPQGYLNVPVWLTQGTYSPWLQEGKYPHLAKQIYLAQPIRTHIEDADDLVPIADNEHAQEFFQIFRHNGQPMQRSKSMGEHSFALADDLRAKVLLTESFDEVEISPGVKAARVTLKTTVPRLRFFAVSWPWRGPPYGPPTPKGFKGPSSGSRPPRLGGFESVAPVVFIQYASDLGPTQAKIRDLQRERDTQLAQLTTTIDNDLTQLRSRMLGIALATLLAIWIGG